MLNHYIDIYLQNRPLFFSLIRPQEAELFHENLNLLKNPILDLGCGDGFFAKTVFGKNKIDIGLDVENERTEKIQNSGIYKKIVFFDGVKIPYPDNYFQTIVSNCVLEHVEKIPALLQEVRRVLAPKGFFLTTIMTEKWEEYLLGVKIFGEKYAQLMRKKQDHKSLLPYESWGKIFINTGFKIEREVGYLSEKTSQWLDVMHYVSAPQLITWRLFGRWVVLPQLFKILPVGKIIKRLIKYPVEPNESAALFFVLL